MHVCLTLRAALVALVLVFGATLRADNEQEMTPCVRATIVSTGVMTNDTTGGGWAIGNDLWIVARPHTEVEERLYGRVNKRVSILIREEP